MARSFLHNPFPFELPVGDDLLHCQKLLRAIPGSRLIMSGFWQGKPVLAKIFLKPLRGWVEFNRELRGTQALLAAHIATPVIVYADYLKKSAAFIILFEFLNDAVEVNHYFQTCTSSLERLALVRQWVEITAQQHQKGIFQTDLHLKNFIFAHNVLYSVDTGSIRIQKGALSTKKSLSSLALLLAQITLMEDSLKTDVVSCYFQARGWDLEPHLLNYLHKKIGVWQKKREKTLRSKLFRSSTNLVAEKTKRQFWVCDRGYLTDELLVLLKCPEYLFSTHNMQIIKDGWTTTVGVVHISNHSFLVKRYNIKNFWHRLKRLVTKTRAKKSWENAHRLLFRGIPTPKPIAMIENRRGIFRGVCYFICEYIPSVTISDYFRPHHFDLLEGRVVAEQILKILQDLAENRVYHGDLKATNLLMNEKGIWLIDLDAVRFYKNRLYFNIQSRKDRERFMRNWQGQPMIGNLFE